MTKTKKLLTLLVILAMAIVSTVSVSAAAKPAAASGDKLVNINSADVETLCTLKGIGPSLAQRIKEFREQNGPFKKPEDITLVRGVGGTILEWNKNLIDIK